MDACLYAVRIFTRDWNRAVSFYRDTVGLPAGFADESMGWAEFSVGPARLAVEAVRPDDPVTQDLVGRFVGVSLKVDDIDAAYTELTGKGVRFTGAPERQQWGGMLAHFEDPDGNVLTLLGS